MARVQLIDVKKIYQGKVTAVHDFNLDIADKEFVVFVGPSGCGKSTTLRMVAGLEDISEGTCMIDGVVVNDLLPKDRHISMVFQNYALYPHLTVFENMAFPLRLDKTPRVIPWTEEEKMELEEKIAQAEKGKDDKAKAKADALREKCKNKTIFEVDNSDKVSKIIGKTVNKDEVVTKKNSVEVHSNLKDTASINKALVEAGVGVKALYSSSDSLEEYFMKRIGG